LGLAGNDLTLCRAGMISVHGLGSLSGRCRNVRLGYHTSTKIKFKKKWKRVIRTPNTQETGQCKLDDSVDSRGLSILVYIVQ
jgi:hypothetical protein